MKKVLIFIFLTASNSIFAFSNVVGGGVANINPNDDADKITIISRANNEPASKTQSGKTLVMVQEIENDEFGSEFIISAKEVEVVSTEFGDDNFIYVNERKDLIGYALQLASFSDLTLAKEYALKVTRKGDAEKRQLFIYTVNNPEKVYYKVYFGLLKSDELAREKQRNLLSLGYSPFVREFR